jgi:hypothetical protein
LIRGKGRVSCVMHPLKPTFSAIASALKVINRSARLMIATALI